MADARDSYDRSGLGTGGYGRNGGARGDTGFPGRTCAGF